MKALTYGDPNDMLTDTQEFVDPKLGDMVSDNIFGVEIDCNNYNKGIRVHIVPSHTTPESYAR